MQRNEPVPEIISSQVATVQHGDPASEVRQLVEERSVHDVPVVSGKPLVGIVSLSDICDYKIQIPELITLHNRFNPNVFRPANSMSAGMGA